MIRLRLAAAFLSVSLSPSTVLASQATVDGLVAEIKAIAVGVGGNCEKVASQYQLAQAIRVIRARHIGLTAPDSIANIEAVHAKCFGPATPSPGRHSWGGGVFDARVPEIAAALAFMPGVNRDRFEEFLPDGTRARLEAWRQANPEAVANLQQQAAGELWKIAIDERSQLLDTLQQNSTPVDPSLRESLDKQIQDLVGATSPPD